jgi:hypothetical protein
VKTPIGAMAARPSGSPKSDFSVVLGNAQRAGGKNRRISNGARIHDADAFYKRADARFPAMTRRVADVQAVACEFAAE